MVSEHDDGGQIQYRGDLRSFLVERYRSFVAKESSNTAE